MSGAPRGLRQALLAVLRPGALLHGLRPDRSEVVLLALMWTAVCLSFWVSFGLLLVGLYLGGYLESGRRP